MTGCTRLFEKDFTRIHEKLDKCSSKWRKIGEYLGFLPSELSNIEAAPNLFYSAPSSYMSRMLSDWLQWAPDDARGSSDYATMNALRTAVSKADLEHIAEELY